VLAPAVRCEGRFTSGGTLSGLPFSLTSSSSASASWVSGSALRTGMALRTERRLPLVVPASVRLLRCTALPSTMYLKHKQHDPVSHRLREWDNNLDTKRGQWNA
jgi:hypothetical protein